MNTSKIGIFAGGFLILIAILVDAAQWAVLLIPYVGWLITPVISVVAALVFGMIFSILGVSMLSPKRILRFLGTLAGELAPLFGGIPFWTGTVAYTVIEEWRRPSDI